MSRNDTDGAITAAAFDETLLEILVCPVSGGDLRYDKHAGELVCESSGLAYPVRDGIPVMLPDEARKINTDNI